jgi:type I restriction enzyme, S subunit
MSKWPTVALRELLTPADENVPVQQGSEYPNFGMYSFGRGLFEKPPISGAKTSAPSLRRVRAGNFVFSRLFAFEGAYGLVDDVFDGYFVSNEYPSFQIDTRRLNARFLKLYFQLPRVWQEVAIGSKGVGSRRVRVQPAQMLTHAIPLPPISEQERIVSHFDGLAEKTRQLNEHLAAIEADANSLLAERFSKIIQAAPVKPLAEIAPIIRRPATISSDEKYTEIGIRSFYKGIFHRRTVSGSEFSWQDLFIIKKDDLVFSNIMAWERAIAIASAEDNNCIANHRMLACEVKNELATPEFAWYYFTTPTGFSKIEAASPGTAARNKTLKSTDLMSIKIPTPSLAHQQEFSQLFNIVRELKNKHAEISRDNEKLIPATLERIFLR